MQNLIYRSFSKLTCECGASVIICVVDGIMLDGSNFLPATLTNVILTTNCDGVTVYNYYLDYDEALLLDPTVLVTSFDVTGIFCNGCMMAYIEHLITVAIQDALAGGFGN